MTEITDEYRQKVIDKLVAAESGANVSESANTNKPRAAQQVCVNRVETKFDDPIAQVMQNKLDMERQENSAMDTERAELTENIHMDIIESLIK